MNRARKPFFFSKHLLPALLLAVALVTSGTVIPDLQPAKGEQGAGFFAQTAGDATTSGVSKSAPVLHVTERFTPVVPTVARSIFFAALVFFSPLLAPGSVRTRAPPMIPAFS